MSNRALLNRRTFDWLDDVFAGRFGWAISIRPGKALKEARPHMTCECQP